MKRRSNMDKVELPFLGKRNYLQGTTLLECFLRNMPVCQNFTFKIYKPILSNRLEIFSSEIDNCQASIVSSGSGLYARQLPRIEPVSRETFDENAINGGLHEKAGVFCLSSSPYPLIPSLVSVFKHILLSSHPQPAVTQNEHWAFVGLEVKKWQGHEFCPLAINNVFCRNGLGRCECSAENGFAGILYFAWVNFGV